ncbi:neck whiskers protein [Shewanella phage Thanatos-1]|nr:neck whiskers protein [Shewanella phage Thanatos-1]
MEKLHLSQLPYVDGLPDTGQIRINWPKNGEEFTAATTVNGNDGTINRSGVAIQKNVIALKDNETKVELKVNELVDNVNTINQALNIVDNEDIIAQVTKNRLDIVDIKADATETKTQVNDISLAVGELQSNMGEYDPLEDSVYRTVRNDLLWIKTEMGQYPGQDINGQSKDGNDSTGMKRRIMSTAFVVNQQGERLTTLEQKFIDSDVGSLTNEVESIRRELGPKGLATVESIYLRLRGLDSSMTSVNNQIFSISESIGLTVGVSNLNNVVTANSNRIYALETKSTNHESRLVSVEMSIGTDSIPSSIKGRIKTNTESIGSINAILGADSSSGLRGQVAWINQVIGIVPEGQPAPANSIIDDVDRLNSTTLTLQNTVQDIQVELGNNSEGIKGQLINLTNITFGTNPNGATVEERGLLNVVKAHEVKLSTVTELISEAPKDGKAYVRKNGAWVTLESELTTLGLITP